MSKFLKENCFYRGVWEKDLFLSTTKFENYIGTKLSIGLNKVVFNVTNAIYPRLSKGLAIDIMLDVILPSNHSEMCLFVKDTFSMDGRGVKANGEWIMKEFFMGMVDNEIVYDYHNEKLPDFDEDLKPETMFIGVERSGDFRSRYLTVEHLKFNPTEIKVELSNFNISTQEQVYTYNNHKYSNEPVAYMIFNNALYLNEAHNYCDDYIDFKTYHNDYKGLDLHVIISNIGNWVKIKDLDFIEPAEIVTSLEGSKKWDKDNIVEALVMENEILFSVKFEDIKSTLGHDTWYMLSKADDVITLYKHNSRTKVNIIQVKGEVAFTTDLTPSNERESRFDTSILTGGKYIKADIEVDEKVQPMVLAPISVFSLSEYHYSDRNSLNIYSFRDKLYGIVGEYKKIGFTLDTSSWNYWFAYICEVPANEHRDFYYSYKEFLEKLEKNRKDYSSKKISDDYLTFQAYDSRFKDTFFDIKVGDIVQIITEPVEGSTIKGFKAVVEKVSDNKQLLDVKFFNLFTYQISIECIEKIEE